MAHLLKCQSQLDELSGRWRESGGKGWRDHNRVRRTNCRASREPTKPQARIADGMTGQPEGTGAGAKADGPIRHLDTGPVDLYTAVRARRGVLSWHHLRAQYRCVNNVNNRRADKRSASANRLTVDALRFSTRYRACVLVVFEPFLSALAAPSQRDSPRRRQGCAASGNPARGYRRRGGGAAR